MKCLENVPKVARPVGYWYDGALLVQKAPFIETTVVLLERVSYLAKSMHQHNNRRLYISGIWLL